MSVEFYSESPGKFDSRTLSRETLSGLGVEHSVTPGERDGQGREARAAAGRDPTA